MSRAVIAGAEGADAPSGAGPVLEETAIRAERARPRAVLPWWAAILASIAGAFVYDLGFPSAGIWPLAFVGIALALVALIGRSIGGALLVGYVFGAVFYLVHVSWTGRYLGPIPWLALSLFQAAFVAAGAVAITLAYRWAAAVWRNRWSRLVALPALVAGLWSARELAIGSFPYGGFPWARAAHSQSQSPFADLVSWVGQIGLGFVMVFLVAMAIEWVRQSGWRDPRTARPLVATTIVALVLPAWATTPTGEFRVASVQGNGSAGYFDEREPGDVLTAQLNATEPILDEPGLDVVLWPEGSVDLDPLRNAEVARTLDVVAARADAPLIANTVTVDGESFFNTSLLWRAGEGAVDRHSKRHPVPFGEYIPDREFYMFFAPDLISLVQRGYSPGADAPVFDLGSTTAGLAICFDVIFDEVIYEGVAGGAELYLLQTNNADFRGTDENLQQLAIARLRAIETGRPVVNLSTVGTSQAISADGTTIDALPSDVAGAMVTDVTLHAGITPAVVIGPWLPGAISLVSVLVLAALGVLARRSRSVRHEQTRNAGSSDEPAFGR